MKAVALSIAIIVVGGAVFHVAALFYAAALLLEMRFSLSAAVIPLSAG